jgi:hypothetical protein
MNEMGKLGQEQRSLLILMQSDNTDSMIDRMDLQPFVIFV